MGPVAAKSYQGHELVKAKAQKTNGIVQPAGRAKQAVDYGRRDKGYVFGALQPATGESFTEDYKQRTAVNWANFLEKVDD